MQAGHGSGIGTRTFHDPVDVRHAHALGATYCRGHETPASPRSGETTRPAAIHGHASLTNSTVPGKHGRIAAKMSAGYSGTPLVRKLDIKPGQRVSAPGAPANYRKLLTPMPEG